jgi:tetratricopeptide (TPR) repeat protein
VLPVLVLAVLGASTLEQGAKAVAEQSDDAVKLLERAKGEGPYVYSDYVRLYELLGIAYSYAERKSDALRAFEQVLALEPGHAVSYKLSPKATFLFEDARKQAAKHPSTGIDVQWPRDLDSGAAVPLDLSVIADPMGFLASAHVYWRVKGETDWQVETTELTNGHSARLVLPPQDVEKGKDSELELRVIGLDPKGNEVLRWGTEDFPRELVERYRSPRWPWVLAGVSTFAAISVSVILAIVFTRPLPNDVPAAIQTQTIK